jgi:hypothetical protein
MFPVAHTGAAPRFSEPGDAGSHDSEDRGNEDVLISESVGAKEQEPKKKAEGRGKKARTETAARGEQNCRDKDEEGTPPVKPREKTPGEQERDTDGRHCGEIMGARNVWIAESCDEAL